MLEDWRRRRNADRSTAGDGRPLQPIRWWQVLGRSLFHLEPDVSVGRTDTHTVDVRHGGDAETGEVRAHLYVDGHLAVESKLPAAFEVPGGVIEVDRTELGLKRCHLVTPDGTATMLTPDPRSPEGRRLRLDRRHPGLSRAIGAVSVVVLLLGLVVLLLQLAEQLLAVPPVVERWGTWESPLALSWEANTAVTVATVLAATERALRLRYHWLLDGSAG